ncbi:MAG TPA: cytochrome c3 family protein [Candidatus Binatia bacterium]
MAQKKSRNQRAQPVAPAKQRRSPNLLWAGVLGVTLAVAGGLLYFWHGILRGLTAEEENSRVAQYVGSGACVSCHAAEGSAWRKSQHHDAMAQAGEQSVLGNFNNARFAYAGLAATFFKRDGKYFVNTDGPDGKLAGFAVKYTFGVYPLQQYLIEFPGGRLQALSIAWDSRLKEQGGQRWFHLYPNERITHDDELHWTRRAQNWNFMCAECHSTHLEKNYDAAKHEYETTWSEINVSCEACHGPGSDHIAWAKEKSWWKRGDDRNKGLAVVLDERKDIRWLSDSQTGNPRRSATRTTEKEIQLCARCHSRRAQLFGDDRPGQPLMDTHLPALLVEGLYHSDGQIDGEVYEYGSFIQSKMYQAGVTCSDCHNPHTLKLRATGNALCAQCHSAEKYATAKHHFHATGKAGSECVDCHMPAKNYMVVDPRRDHSLRIPRPDLSVKLGTPNACNGCHRNKSPEWAENKRREWYGAEPKGYQRYAETLHAARAGARGAEDRLIALSRDHGQPAIARATAVAELGNRLSQQTFSAVVDGLSDPDPMVRAAALEALERIPPEQRWQAAHKLLRDSVRAVRIRAAGLLAAVRPESLAPADRTDFQRASDEYVATQRHNADDPAAQVNLGNFYAARGAGKQAEESYRAALDLDPDWVPAYVNLADLMRATNRDDESEKILGAGIARQPKAAALYHSLGLAQVRKKNLSAALASLRRAMDLAPNETRYSYVYAVALHDAGRGHEALGAIDAALKRAPQDPSLNELRMQLAVGK